VNPRKHLCGGLFPLDARGDGSSFLTDHAPHGSKPKTLRFMRVLEQRGGSYAGVIIATSTHPELTAVLPHLSTLTA
jgi:hypothetical protein